ncbi:hypothetical protein RM190_04830 [Paracoccus sp. CPCC 101403]|uniref:Uncharacterized protein n=1 Tax=Paracoccus broussonetiae TaxID=3075834 RepID=A0ABU3EAC3_9RHOB|nr:hypothetical protein [Paracoccus sp. CPCC 101403]MDT1061173.1 hypothetical protein [Paracoccus sp. CPCC 101403]
MEHISHIWPTLAELAEDLGKPYPTVAAWKHRGRIPSDYDFDLIAAAERRGKMLTLEELAAARRSPKAAEGAA